MKLWRITIILSAFMASALVMMLIITSNVSSTQLDSVAVNDIVKNCEANWDNILNSDVSGLKIFDRKLDYSVVNNDFKLLYSTSKDVSVTVNDAIKHRDTVVDIISNGNTVGKVIIYNDSDKQLKSVKSYLIIGTAVIFLLLFLVFIGYITYLRKALVQPFNKLKSFAQSIAGGNLDVPLAMDRNNLFGAFTESFDIMREELAKSRENERKANQSKKELVAQLSHDIKTPVASIKAISELMQVKTMDEKENNQLETIGEKADQIDLLINNMFHATLEELQELKVNPREEESTQIPDLILKADYRKLANLKGIPDCIVIFDKLRLQQVFDNIISNSYKYAATPIDITAKIEQRNLIINFRDYGRGVLEEELLLLYSKYYRGTNAKNKSGSGLGLYISKYFMQQMNGDIYCNNLPDGFAVTIELRIS